MIRHPHQPVADCNHDYSMHYDRGLCWCRKCGQTWKLLKHESGDPKTWYPLPIKEMERGVRLQEVGWGSR